MSDTWGDIQALKNKQLSLREKLARRRQETQEMVAEIIAVTGTAGSSPVARDVAAPTSSPPSSSTVTSTSTSSSSTTPASSSSNSSSSSTNLQSSGNQVTAASPATPKKTVVAAAAPTVARLSGSSENVAPELLAAAERRLLMLLSDVTLILPVEVSQLTSMMHKQMDATVPIGAVEDLLQKFAAQMLIILSTIEDAKPVESRLVIDSVDHKKLSAVTTELQTVKQLDVDTKKRKREGEPEEEVEAKKEKTEQTDSIESLLSTQTAKQKENSRTNDEILQLLSQPTAKEKSLIERFRSVGGAQVQEFCQYGTMEECHRLNTSQKCGKLHFRKIIHKHTDESLGDCSFLNTCFHMDTCKYVHYEITYPERVPRSSRADIGSKGVITDGSSTLYPPQWVQCDLRKLDMTVLGKFAVVMADPPWDIHMELPYGTMSDDEMRALSVPTLQDEGYIFLWVTGRAMELGRECLRLWGYERVDELIWVKTNQLQRIIRTGRTGHWLNHGKEHCLVGVKGNPKTMNRGMDCDVIVAEVRATSHKPDEIYGIIERLSPGTRKIELFGRPHNVQPNWITLGNQVDGVKLIEPDVVKAFKKRYPDGDCLGK